MGCSASCQSSEAAAAANRTRDIDLKLETSRKIAQKQPKILLLGSGGGGKSTIAKQLRIIHGTGYTKNDRIMYRPVIYSNCLQSLLEIIGAMEKLGALFYEPSRMNDVATLMGLAKNFKEEYITKEVGELMLRLWRDVGVQNAISGSAKYQLNDSASNFLKSKNEFSTNSIYLQNKIYYKLGLGPRASLRRTSTSRDWNLDWLMLEDRNPKEKNGFIVSKM